MVAVRRFGPVDVPVSWTAEQWADPRRRADLQLALPPRSRVRPAACTSRGTSGRSPAAPTGRERDDRARLQPAAAAHRAGRRAGRHRPPFRATHRRPHAGHLQDAGRTAVHESAAPHAASGSPASACHADRHRPRRVLGRPSGRSLAGQAHRPLRPSAVPLAGRGPGRRLRPDRLHRRSDGVAARPVQPVLARRRACWPWPTPGSSRARGRRRAPDRFGVYVGSALGGIAYAEEQHERYLDAGHPHGGARTWRWPCSAARRRPTWASSSACTGRSCRRPTRAPRARWHWARRLHLIRSGARRRCTGRRRRGAAVAALLWRLRHHSRPVGRPQRPPRRGMPAVRRRARRLRDGRRRGAARARGRGGRAGARRHAVRRAAWLRRDERRLPHGPAATRRTAGGARGASGPRGWPHARDRRRLRQRPCLVDAAGRRGRGAGAAPGARQARERESRSPARRRYYGHPLGASGAIEAAICALAISRGWAPGTVNLEQPRPAVSEHLPCARSAARGRNPGRAVDIVRLRRPQRRAGLQGCS